MAIPSKKNGDGFWRNDQPPAVADPTLDALIVRLAAFDHSCANTHRGWTCGGQYPQDWCRACCARALTAHVRSLTATLDAIRAEVERSTPQPPGGQQVGPRPGLWSMSVSTRRALVRLLGDEALPTQVGEEASAPAPDMFAAYRYHPNCTSATGWCPVCARVQQSTFRAPTPQFRDYEGDVIAGPDPFRDARVDASVAYAAGAAAGREFGRGEAAPAPTVGCEDADGLLHVHPESATCAVCAPTVHAPKETP